jgi:hypothetical protein
LPFARSGEHLCIASGSTARRMASLTPGASISETTLIGCAFPASVCAARECLRYQYDFTANWELEIRLEESLPLSPQGHSPVCIGGKRAVPPEDCAGAWAYLEQLERHRCCHPLEELRLVAETMQRFVDSGGGRQALGDLEELQEAVDRLGSLSAISAGAI